MSKLPMPENNQNVKARILNRIDLIGKLEEVKKRYMHEYDPELKKIKVYGIFDEKTAYDNLLLFHASDVIKYLKGSTENKKWFIKNFRQPVELIQINISIPLDNHTKPLKCNLLTMCGVLRAVHLCEIETDNRKINEKAKTYKYYCHMLPKKNVFLKYVKSSRKKSNEKVLQHIADHYTISLGEAEDYIHILKKEGVEHILEKAGVDEKEIKKLLKEIQ